MKKEQNRVLVDTHCHVLPGVDDGAESMKYAIGILKAAASSGVGTVIATPHYHPQKGNEDMQKIRSAFRALQKRAAALEIPVNLYLGQEILYSSDLADWLDMGICCTMNDTGVVMIEFPKEASFEQIYSAASRLRRRHYRTLLAHAEQYKGLRVDSRDLQELSDLGVLFQVNAGTILGNNGFGAKRFAEQLMDNDLLTCLGSDAHDPAGEKDVIRKAFLKISQKRSSLYAHGMIVDNPTEIFRLERPENSDGGRAGRRKDR